MNEQPGITYPTLAERMSVPYDEMLARAEAAEARAAKAENSLETSQLICGKEMCKPFSELQARAAELERAYDSMKIRLQETEHLLALAQRQCDAAQAQVAQLRELVEKIHARIYIHSDDDHKLWMECRAALSAAPAESLRHYQDKARAHSTRLVEALNDVLSKIQPDGARARLEWQQAAYRVGEELGENGPDGYYQMTADQWREWALLQTKRINAERFRSGISIDSAEYVKALEALATRVIVVAKEKQLGLSWFGDELAAVESAKKGGEL